MCRYDYYLAVMIIIVEALFELYVLTLHILHNVGTGPFDLPNFSFFVPAEYLATMVMWWSQHRSSFPLLVHPNSGTVVIAFFGLYQLWLSCFDESEGPRSLNNMPLLL